MPPRPKQATLPPVYYMHRRLALSRQGLTPVVQRNCFINFHPGRLRTKRANEGAQRGQINDHRSRQCVGTRGPRSGMWWERGGPRSGSSWERGARVREVRGSLAPAVDGKVDGPALSSPLKLPSAVTATALDARTRAQKSIVLTDRQWLATAAASARPSARPMPIHTSVFFAWSTLSKKTVQIPNVAKSRRKTLAFLVAVRKTDIAALCRLFRRRRQERYSRQRRCVAEAACAKQSLHHSALPRTPQPHTNAH